MFTEEQLDQLRGLLSPIERRLERVEEQNELHRQESKKEHKEMLLPVEQRLGRLEERVSPIEERLVRLEEQNELHRQESKKEHGEMGELMGGFSEHMDKSIVAASEKTVQILTDRMSVPLQSNDRRITRVEKHLALKPLD